MAGTKILAGMAAVFVSAGIGCRELNPDFDGPAEADEGTETLGSDIGGDGLDTPGPETDSEGTTGESGDGETTAGSTCEQVPGAPGGSCPAVCSGGCSADTCLIACAEKAQCTDDVLACPPGWHCQVSCLAEDACKDTTVLCPAEYQCSVECGGKSACDKMAVDCADGPCAAVCGADQDVCKSMQFRCGERDGSLSCSNDGDSDGPEAMPYPGSACACESLGCG